MANKPSPTVRLRVRKSFDLTDKAWASLREHSDLSGKPIVGIINLLCEDVLPGFTARLRAKLHAKQQAQAQEEA